MATLETADPSAKTAEELRAQTDGGNWSAMWAEQIKQELQLQPDGRFSWDQISRLLAMLRTKFSNYAWRTVAKPKIRAYQDPTTGRSRVRLYYLISNDFHGQTLWCADVDGLDDGNGDNNCRVTHKRLLNLASLKSLNGGGRTGLSRDEELLQERKRSFSTGITDYDMEPVSGTVLFAYQNFVCYFVDNLSTSVGSGTDTDGECQPLGFQTPHSPLNLALCPGEPRLAAYAAERSVYCVCLTNGDIALAYSLPSESPGHISAGLPPFAVQEEFDRFHGFWWRPATAGAAVHDLAIEVVDEAGVTSVSIVDPLKAGLESDSFAYPRAGTPNADSSLVMVRVSLQSCKALSDQAEDLGLGPVCSEPLPLPDQLGSRSLPPGDREYLVRVDWSPCGQLLLAQTMNRAQDRLTLTGYRPESGLTIGLMVESAPDNRWIEVHDLLKILSVSDTSAEFLWASEESGYRHLYHVTSQWTATVAEGSFVEAKFLRRQLTRGDWQVQPDHLAVDTEHGRVYFNATVLDPRSVQLCRLAFRQSHHQLSEPPQVEVLTGGHNSSSAGVAIPKTCNGLAFPCPVVNAAAGLALLTVHCSSHSPSTRLCRLENIGGGAGTALAELTAPIQCDNFFLEPEYFSFVGPGGQTLHGLLFKPFDYRVGHQYPTLQYVYGGPHVQLVNNTFVGYSFHRVTKACYLGFCVLIVDNRGSDNRGREFAAEVRHRMGSVELPDQVAGLHHAAEKFGCIDLNRVALFGWSYGGYLSLIGMRDFNRVYRLAVAGAPVTEWELYDTAYTERYMGLPDGPGGRYEAASAIGASVGNYPSDANRLLIVHGSIDENVHFYHTARLLDRLANARKPYNLLIYPSERHGLRNTASKEHFEVSLMHFLCQNI